MKKILDCFVLALVFVIVYCIYQCSAMGGIPGDYYIKNDLGGYNIYLRGKQIGYSRVNNSGGYDIIIKGRLKYKAVTSANGRTRYETVKVSKGKRVTNPREYESKKPYSQRVPSVSNRERYDEWLKKWSSQRRESINKSGMKWWEITNPGTFHK